jgi:hypothetical protein
MQSKTFHGISLRSILILSSHLYLFLLAVSFLQGSLQKYVCACLFSHTCYMICLSNPPSFDHSRIQCDSKLLSVFPRSIYGNTYNHLESLCIWRAAKILDLKFDLIKFIYLIEWKLQFSQLETIVLINRIEKITQRGISKHKPLNQFY